MTFNYKSSELTKNLKSIEFEAVIGKENHNYLPLRNRSHCLFTNACFHVYYYVNIYDLFRRGCILMKKKGVDVGFSRLSLSVELKSEEILNVGIVGFGRLGNGIITEILDSRILAPANLYVYTRNTDSLNSIKERSVKVDPTGSEIRDKCSLIIICVPPCQIEMVSKIFRGELPFDTVLYVFTTGIPLERLHRLFEHESIITEQYLWNDDFYNTWNCQLSISEALENNEIIEKTCPLDISITNAIYINCSQKLFVLWIFSLCNVADVYELNEKGCLRLLNFILLNQDPDIFLEISDIIHDLELQKSLPRFSLCSISNKTTFLDLKMADSIELRNKLLENYRFTLYTFSKNKKFNV